MTTSPDLAPILAALEPPSAVPGVVRVGIDGVDGAGKTVFADRLAEDLTALGRPVIRSTVDGFHHARAVRYRQGRQSPEGYFADSFDYDLLRARLLDPLSPGGNGIYRTVAFDHHTDTAIQARPRRSTPGAVLVFDGVFLHREELLPYWDFSIFLRVRFDETFRRMAVRDGGPPSPDASANRRYLEGQRLYLRTCDPEQRASVVIDNG